MIIKELYKNKKLIIVFLIIIFSLIFIKNGGMRKTIENFENKNNVIDTLISTYDIAERKINDVFTSISATDVKMKKNISTEGNISNNGNINTKGNITNNGNLNTGNIKGKTITGNKLCIGNTCITEKQLKYLTNGFTLITKSNGHKRGGFIHTYSDGSLRYALPKHKTTYQMQ